MSNPLLAWRKAATSDEWKRLAELAGTTAGYLNLIAYGNRNASPKLAQSIEAASKLFSDKHLIRKEDLVFYRAWN